MSLPRIAAALLRRLAPEGHAEDVLGDLEEAHSRRLETGGASRPRKNFSTGQPPDRARVANWRHQAREPEQTSLGGGGSTEG